MSRRTSWLIGSIFCAILFTAGTVKANTVELITNGGFETGTLTGWTEYDTGGGYWSVSSSTLSPIEGNPTPGANSGTYYALTDQGEPSAMTLLQTFTVPVGATSITLSFDMFTENWYGSNTCTSGPGGLAYGNQCAYVDILSSAAIAQLGTDPLYTGSGVDNLFNGGSPVTNDINNNPVPNPYSPYTYDLTGLSAGTYALRFGTAASFSPFNQGIDNVSILATTSVPEPSTLLLLGVGLLGMVLAGSLKRKAVDSVSA